MTTRYCIHGRSEKQKCSLCHLRSQCCDGAVIKLNNKEFVCETCGKKCKTYKEKVNG